MRASCPVACVRPCSRSRAPLLSVLPFSGTHIATLEHNRTNSTNVGASHPMSALDCALPDARDRCHCIRRITHTSFDRGDCVSAHTLAEHRYSRQIGYKTQGGFHHTLRYSRGRSRQPSDTRGIRFVYCRPSRLTGCLTFSIIVPLRSQPCTQRSRLGSWMVDTVVLYRTWMMCLYMYKNHVHKLHIVVHVHKRNAIYWSGSRWSARGW